MYANIISPSMMALSDHHFHCDIGQTHPWVVSPGPSQGIPLKTKMAK